MQSRIDLAKFFRDSGFRKGVEIGVADGRYSKILCENIPGLQLYCVDVWAPYLGNWRDQNAQDRAYTRAQETLKDFDVTLIKETSVKASTMFKDECFDFVFIDGSHLFDHVMTDIILWSKKVRRRGIVAGHDYCHFTDSGVVEAVNKYCEVHKLELNLIGRYKENHKDDRQPTWWYVKR